MNFSRDDTLDVSRSDDSTNVITKESFSESLNDFPSENSLSLSFSSDRFNSNDFEEETTINSINESNNLFSGLKKKEPTLEEALESMGYEKCKELSDGFLERGKDKLSELNAPGIAAEDIAAIFCYTFEWNEKARIKYGEGESPYRKLNNSLSVDRNNKTLKKTRHFLFLLLKALRKLPRFVPDNRTLYRGIRAHVQTEPDPNYPKRKPYATGNEKFWWTFTSTTIDLEITKRFIKGNDGSLFMLSGETWGYDISLFSDFPDEKEILLEPERKLSITSVTRNANIITVNAKILDTPLVLKDIINVGKTVKIKEKKSKHKEVPQNLRTTNATESTVELAWDAVDKVISYQVSSRMVSSGLFNRNPVNMLKTEETKCIVRELEHEAEYEFRVRCVFDDGVGKWGEMFVVKVIPFSESSWKKCPQYVDNDNRYLVNNSNPKIVTKITVEGHCTVIGNTPLHSKVTPWNIKILRSENNDGNGFFIGVAPFDINQFLYYNFSRCGWYFNCYHSILWSGPPHKYSGKEYGPRKRDGEYVHTGDTVGVMMDATKGELSFVLNGVNLGAAYEGIPLDKPLVPCVIFRGANGSVELITSEVKENVNSCIPVPSNITAKSITWDSITLTWNTVEGASFYQIEVVGSKSWNVSTINIFTKSGFISETEHSFRIRAVKGNSASEWSDVVKGKTVKAPKSFECSVWKECPDYVDEKRKYSVDENITKIATFVGGDWCTIIGNTPLPPNKVISWSIKIIQSKYGKGDGIYIGVTPFDINQNEDKNHNKRGWYFDCHCSSLCSGSPHNYYDKEYGPIKGRGSGEYVHTGDNVGVAMDTTKGKLSFTLNGVNLGVAYKRIPLDKPLVPCVILLYEGDSVELIINKE